MKNQHYATDSAVIALLYSVVPAPAFKYGLWLTVLWFGSMTRSALAQSGAALNFDGANDFVVVPHNVNLNFTNTFTLSLWFKANNNSQTQKYLMAKGNSYGIIYEYVDNQIEFSSGALRAMIRAPALKCP
ncbi:MAG: LamG-like jellyroll fold domain-containing protein [Spirosomataceae bacterium]